ncbi:MAG: histidine kinase [Saprospiraceae bacterium]|nr:histidine kinase [Saprospiraceae bacterium]
MPGSIYLWAMPVKRYSKKEPLVFIWIMVPYIFFMNWLIFGNCIFTNWIEHVSSFFISGLYFVLVYGVFGSVAVIIQRRFPAAGDLFLRVRIMLPVFYMMNVVAVSAVFGLYSYFNILNCTPLFSHLWWTILYACIMSTVITFINEGLSNWEKWKNSLSEGERLKNAYRRTKLLGLKGQINPHFLFNCFNTLSGLIAVDEEKAEQFLDDMTLVHRYLLRNEDDYLVELKDELRFAKAYLRLTCARFGDSVKCDFSIEDEKLNHRIPPLSLHVLLEYIIYTNAMSKESPIEIKMETRDLTLVVQHNIQLKTIVRSLDLNDGLDNLVEKFKLLHGQEMQIMESSDRREIVLPLFEPKNMKA